MTLIVLCDHVEVFCRLDDSRLCDGGRPPTDEELIEELGRRGWMSSTIPVQLSRDLAELENGQKVWWCEEHKSPRVNKMYPGGWRCGQVILDGNWAIDAPCRMVEGLLTVETPWDSAQPFPPGR